jgi:GNAT superfamily N-acetyltransferase
MVRPATLADVPRVVEMAEHFGASDLYSSLLRVDPARIGAFVVGLLDREDGVLLVYERDGVVVGMVALIAFAHHWTGEQVASELVWWVEPEARGRAGLVLLKAAEQWARAHGCAVVQMIAPSPEVARFYAAVGYTEVERGFQRRV